MAVSCPATRWPAYEQGNVLVLNPSVQPQPGDDVDFMREAKDGTRHVLIS
jgi:hypothetical protein